TKNRWDTSSDRLICAANPTLQDFNTSFIVTAHREWKELSPFYIKTLTAGCGSS
ncbi:hypothetical protein J6590_100224, partial [Homalodisca vitripennis]